MTAGIIVQKLQEYDEPVNKHKNLESRYHQLQLELDKAKDGFGELRKKNLQQEN